MQIEAGRGATRAGSVLLLATLAAAMVGCGSASPRSSNEIDRGFADDMVIHHQEALGMARIALRRSQHPRTRALAKAIISAQTREIGALRRLRTGFAHQGADGLETLPLDKEASGMLMNDAGLRTAKPFDRAFIDMMVAHHVGAIEMSHFELQRGANAVTKQLATRIIREQAGEVRLMSRWEKQWYGRHPRGQGAMPSMQMGG